MNPACQYQQAWHTKSFTEAGISLTALFAESGLSFQAWIADPAAAHTRRSTGCDGSTQACLTGPIPLTVMTAG